MPVETTVEFPAADTRALFAQMERNSREFGRTLGSSLRFAGWSVASSLGAATRVAKKYRPYHQRDEARGVASARGKKAYRVTSHKKGGANKFTVYAASVKELKTMPQVRIGRAGLAKSAWFWGIKGIGGGRNISTAGATPGAKSGAGRFMETEKRLTGDDPFIRIVNSLPYARDAMRGGDARIQEAMGKAARQMERIIDANIKKAMAAK